MNTLLLLALIGSVSGLISGSVGLAGGIVLVPAVVALIGPGAIAEAIVVSFFAVLLNSLSATLANRRARGGQAFRALVLETGWYTAGAAAAALAVAITVGRHSGAVPHRLVAAVRGRGQSAGRAAAGARPVRRDPQRRGGDAGAVLHVCVACRADLTASCPAQQASWRLGSRGAERK